MAWCQIGSGHAKQAVKHKSFCSLVTIFAYSGCVLRTGAGPSTKPIVWVVPANFKTLILILKDTV